jgi:Cd2+/Zn2+-exporting ATPase
MRIARPDAPSTCAQCEQHVETVYRVAGMDCHDEVAILERRFKRLPGFEAMTADLVGQRLRIAHDAARLSPPDIIQAVAETGMHAWPEGQGRPTAAQRSSAASLYLVIASGVMLIVGVGLKTAGFGLALTLPAFAASVAFGGILTVRRAAAAVRTFLLDINVLMLVAVIGAIAIGEWSEAATVIFLFALAQLLETRSMERARHAIRALMDLTPDEATVRRGGVEQRVQADEIGVGETIVIRPGEKIPLDGRVVHGESEVNQAPITGESLPVDKVAGREVYAGSINGRGALEVEVTHLRRDTTLARIIGLVETAQAQRAPAQVFIDRFARYYTPAVMTLAGVIAVVPPLLLGRPFEVWFYRALVLLVISCPCALVISTPVSIVSALAGAARRGVLIKGGLYLERAGRIRSVAFDKTGTLTTGRPEVVDVIALDGAVPAEILRIAAALESRSEHPIADAIVRRATADLAPPIPAGTFRSLPGLGAEALVDGQPVLVGNHRLFADRRLCTPQVDDHLETLGRRGQTAVLVASRGRVIGLIGVADRTRDSGRDAVERLHHLGVERVVMLTGDNENTARAIADELGVDEVRAELLPEDKVLAVNELRQQYGEVMMVGDGVNDAPALAAADLGVAMGAAGSDTALETADVALMADDLRRIPYLVRLSRVTLRNVKANVTFSLGLKSVFLVLGVMGAATLWMAVVADMGASLLVIANGLRLLRAE